MIKRANGSRQREGRTECEKYQRGRREGMACVLADASSDCFLMRRSSDDRGEILIANLIDLF